jgi:hypothetical protein
MGVQVLKKMLDQDMTLVPVDEQVSNHALQLASIDHSARL